MTKKNSLFGIIYIGTINNITKPKILESLHYGK